MLKAKNDLHLVFLSSAIQRHNKDYFMNFIFDHAGWHSPVAKYEKFQAKVGQKLTHTQK